MFLVVFCKMQILGNNHQLFFDAGVCAFEVDRILLFALVLRNALV